MKNKGLITGLVSAGALAIGGYFAAKTPKGVEVRNKIADSLNQAAEKLDKKKTIPVKEEV